MNLKFVISLLVSLFIASCSEYKEEYIDGDDLIPPAPPFWEYFTVEGFDVDQDGVRDDYELEVNESFDEYNLRKALKEEYKVHSRFLNAQSSDEGLKLLSERWVKSNCTLALMTYYKSKYSTDEVSKFRKLRLNNYWRTNNFNQKFRSLIPKGVHSTGMIDNVKGLEDCSFVVKDKDNILQFIINR